MLSRLFPRLFPRRRRPRSVGAALGLGAAKSVMWLVGGWFLLRAVFDPTFLQGFVPEHEGPHPDPYAAFADLSEDVAVARWLYESAGAPTFYFRDPVVWDPGWQPAGAQPRVLDNPMANVHSIRRVRRGELTGTVLVDGAWDLHVPDDVATAVSLCGQALRTPHLPPSTRVEARGGGSLIAAGTADGHSCTPVPGG